MKDVENWTKQFFVRQQCRQKGKEEEVNNEKGMTNFFFEREKRFT